MNIRGVSIPLSCFVPDNNPLVLLVVAILYDFVDNKPTNPIGTKVTVASSRTFDKFVVKLPNVSLESLGITQNDIDNSQKPIRVTFSECFGKIYVNSSGRPDVSFTATGMNVLKPTQS